MNTNTRAMGALRIVLLGLLVAWVLFVFGVHSTYFSSDSDDFTTASESFDPATYFFLAAVAVFGIASLYGKRRAQSLFDSGDPHARPVYYHAFSGLIVATVIGAWAVFMIFFNLLVTDYANVAARVLNTYLPIVLFTGLVVMFLLSGFVFRRPTAADDFGVAPTGGTVEQRDGTRASALAYAVPIISAAIAAITAGLIYDFTGTSLTEWLWVLIFSIVGAGITAGVYFSSRLPRNSGAYVLNFAWVIAFTAIGSIIAFGFGAASVGYLQLYSAVTIDAYSGEASEVTLDSSGNQLESRSEASLILEPEGETLETFTTDIDGWFYETLDFPLDIPEGEHTLTLVGVARDGTQLKASIPFTMEGSEVNLNDADASATDELNRSLPVTFDWVVARALPAFLLLVLVSAVVHVTLPLRARSAQVRKVVNGEDVSPGVPQS